MSLKDDLIAQIEAGKITFDAPVEQRRKELLRENTGTQVTERLQKLVLKVSQITSIRISSIVRTEGHHGAGRAFDVGNEAVAAKILDVLANDKQVAAFHIDEIIFDAAVAGMADRNHWNYDSGVKHKYGEATLKAHRNHVHFSVKATRLRKKPDVSES